MKLLRNLKDWITDLIGLAIMIGTGYAVYVGRAQWMWEGVIGLCVGFVLFWVPDDVILKHLKSKVKKDVLNEDEEKAP